jgi:hypothetical protein
MVDNLNSCSWWEINLEGLMRRTNSKLVIIRKLNSFFKDEKKLMRKK